MTDDVSKQEKPEDQVQEFTGTITFLPCAECACQLLVCKSDDATNVIREHHVRYSFSWSLSHDDPGQDCSD